MTLPTHKNSLWKVLGLYGAGSWVALQIIDVLAQNAGLPSWVFTLALILLILGVPVVGATAYLQGMSGFLDSEPFEYAKEGGTESAPRKFFTWRNAFVGGLAALALWGVLVSGWLFFGPGANRDAADASAAGASSVAPGAVASNGRTADSEKDSRSVAVLPFATRSAEDSDEYFADGMHDDVLTQLAKIDSLTVISRTSVMQYEGTTKAIPEIAAELGVATILEGGIQRAGDRIRVNVQLIEASTDRHLWAETYDEEMTAANVFAIQSDLAEKIALALQATLTPETKARIDARPTESLEAFEAYSRGQYEYWKVGGTLEDRVASAKRHFDDAIAADSNYAAAWAGLADVYVSRVMLSDGQSREELQAQSWDAVDRALELDPDLAHAHSRRGMLLWFRGDVAAAEAAHERAVELEPGSALIHARYSFFLTNLQRYAEAVAAARRAVELDPLAIALRLSLADALFYQADYEASKAEAWKVAELEPGAAQAYYAAGYAHSMLGEHEEAIRAFRRSSDLDPSDPNMSFALAWAYAKAGERDSALATVAGLPEADWTLKEYSIIYGELGDLDTAFDYVDRLLEEVPEVMLQYPSDPTADPLKSDPRYAAALEQARAE